MDCAYLEKLISAIRKALIFIYSTIVQQTLVGS